MRGFEAMRQLFSQSLQVVGLMVVGSALLFGMSTSDSTLELKLLGAGMVLFWMGHGLAGKAEG
jgi:hypothetical protein